MARLSAVCFILSKATIGKERLIGASYEDRLLALCRHAVRRSNVVLLCNRGLYVDQAVAAREAFPHARELLFIVGYDKLVQILDARYYRERETALETLFAQAKLLVAARLGQEAVSFQTLMDHPENRSFRDRVEFLPFPRYLQRFSSTAIRNTLAKAGVPRSRLPQASVELIQTTGAYLPPLQLPGGELIDRYLLRNRLVDAFSFGLPAPDGLSLSDWLAAAWSDSPLGVRLRRLLQDGGQVALAQAVHCLTSVHHSPPP